MFLKIPDVLNNAHIQRLVEISNMANFIEGRITNPHSKVKDNQQLNYDDKFYHESSKILADALINNELLRNFAFPKILAPPMLTKYGPGRKYGLHSDSPFMSIGDGPMRSDMSCTIFISGPEDYEGGALSILLGDCRVEVKGSKGSAIVYPSNTLHEVLPVTAGERIVGLTFLQSRISDVLQRELLYELNEVSALEGSSMTWENYTRLKHVQSNLFRLWAEPG